MRVRSVVMDGVEVVVRKGHQCVRKGNVLMRR
jgi:hypothetical protein